jgi:hypothetical protein
MPGSGTYVDPSRLRWLAKRASDLHLAGGMPLTEAVVQAVRDEPGLGTEHVRRVVEFANNETFQRMFQKEAGDHRVVTFEGGPASPADVLKELNMGALSSPQAVSEKTASLALDWVPGEDSAYGVFDTAKTAEEYPMANPLGDAWRLRDQLMGLRDHFASEHSLAAVRHVEAEDVFVKEAKQVVLDGGSTADISRAVASRAKHPDLAKLALARVQNYFADNGIESVPGPVLAKTGSVPNPNSALLRAYDDYEVATMHRFKVAAAIEHVEDQLSTLNTELRARIR